MVETKHCPYCDEIIKANAKKCFFCGEWLVDKDATQKVEATEGITLIQQALSSKYEIIEEIGKGGMAVVYKARHKNLDRHVALKVVHRNLIHDKEFLERFHREAQLSASLNHPNIVTVYDIDKTGDYNYLAMEFLEGNDLHNIIKTKGKLTVKETINIIIPIAEALDHAHNKGIVHRDIKSANILFTKTGKPVLTDFGIAHAKSSTKLTQTGTIIGTPEYMSPEQSQGNLVDARSDFYSLGVVMYECLTGTVPFKADNPLSVINKIVNEQPLSLLDYNNNLPEWINNIVLSLLENNPDKRLDTGKELAEKLREQKKFEPAKESEKTITHQKEEYQPFQENISNVGIKKDESKKKSYEGLIIILSTIVLIIFGIVYYNNKREQEIIKQQEIEQQQLGQEQKDKEETERLAEQQRQEEQRKLEEQQKKEKQRKLEQQRIEQQRLKIKMVFVKGGTFKMGSNGYGNEKPVHTVTVDDFYIGKYEVTQKQWKEIMGTSTSLSNPFYFKGDYLPVENVSWNDVQDFIKKLNQKTGKHYRLPTEAEWEYAARGGNKSKGYKYSGSNNIEDVAWYGYKKSGNKTHAVGTKQANELGIYDMSGNLWEWCSDWYDKGYYKNSPRNNPQGASSGSYRVNRGGSWLNFAEDCRVASRDSDSPGSSGYYMGFRLVLVP